MSNSKTFLIAIATVLGAGVFLVAGYFGVKTVVAAVTTNYPTLVQNIASKFNLDPQAVQQVFTDTQKQNISNRLEQAVTNKQITEDQKNKILAERDTVQTQITGINNQQLTVQQRNDQLTALRTTVQKWATDNGIPQQFASVVLESGKGGMMGGRGMMKGGWMN